MYDLIQHFEQQFVGQEMYDDEYDEYLLWHSSSPHAIVRVSDPFQIPGIDTRDLYQHLDDAFPTPPASPLLVSYTMTPHFKFPAVKDNGSDIANSPMTETPSPECTVSPVRHGLPTRKRSYSNFF